MNKKNKSDIKPVSLITLVDPSSPVAEQYRTIRTNIRFSSSTDKEIKTIVITSSGPNEGKSTTASNLAVVCADSGQKVLLVDADMRKATIHKTFHVKNNYGLSTLLTVSRPMADTIQESLVPNLSILSSGPKPPNPSELLNSNKMNTIIKEMSENFDLVIFDMPPLVQVTDAQIVSSQVDGAMLVAREDVSSKDSLLKAKRLLTMVNANIIGAVYHGTKNVKEKDYY